MKTENSKTALRFVLLLGVVSLFADMTYEAARSFTGPYLAILGASATAVGIIAGFGELIGYGLRIVSGVISDRTHVIVGHEVKTIIEFVKAHGFDLLVLGFMGHSALYDRVMGSTCQNLVRLAPCSVLVVK